MNKTFKRYGKATWRSTRLAKPYKARAAVNVLMAMVQLSVLAYRLRQMAYAARTKPLAPGNTYLLGPCNAVLTPDNFKELSVACNLKVDGCRDTR